jgi:RNA 3'-phosphate cyclase
MSDLLEIDGSHGEGGGQMMRSAIALSLLTAKPFRMFCIRAGREKPGLKAQHLHALKTSERVFGSRVTGATLGASDVGFWPGPLKGASYEVDIGTAGSICLLLQTLLPAALFADGRTVAHLKGGTDVAMSPTWEFFRNLVLPAALPLCEGAEVACDRRGFYPKGGGHVRLMVRPRFHGDFAALRAAIRAAVPPLNLVDAAPVESVDVYSVAAEELRAQDVVKRQLKGAVEELGELRGVEVRPHSEYARSLSIGTAVCAVATLKNGAVLGGDALGERGKRAEAVGREAAAKLVAQIRSGAPVDEHLADHLVPWMALRGGIVRTSAITDHTRTHCWLVERFLGPTFHIDEDARTVQAAT